MNKRLAKLMDKEGLKRYYAISNHPKCGYPMEFDVLHPEEAERILATAPKDIIGEQT
jgi:hypothetical protein